MTTLDEEDMFLTFDELLQLKEEDICLCIDKHSALNICEKSSAAPSIIFNLWVHRLLKAYYADGLTNKDWQKIIEYLEKVLREFVASVSESDENSCKELEQWWLDSQELLKWIDTTVTSFDVSVLCLIIAFVLEITTKTSKFSNKRNFKVLCTIQQLVVNLCNNHLYKLPVKHEAESESFDKVASSLCDVGSIMSSVDLKTSVETWRAVAKLSEKSYNSENNFLFADGFVKPQQHWSDKAIINIFTEVIKIVKIFDRNPGEYANLLQIAQFYLKIVRLIIKYSRKTMQTFPATDQFIELYTFRQHEMVSKDNTKIDFVIKEPLYNIFLIIYRTPAVTEAVLQHLKCDMDKFQSCNLVFDYLKIYATDCTTTALKPDVEIALKIYNGLLEAPVIFVDKDKYSEFMKYFVILIAVDSTKMMHKELCKYVIDLSWIRAHASMDTLSIYYSGICKRQKFPTVSKCLQFWFAVWNKVNLANEMYRQHKKFVEILLQSILNTIPDDKLQEYNFSIYENNEIILLKSGKEIDYCVHYFNTNLVQNLKKMKQRSINGVAFRELLNLLDACVLRPQLLNKFLRDNLLSTLKDLLTLPAADLQRFHEFINLSFGVLNQTLDQQQTKQFLKYLMEHEEQCCSIESIFFVEFLLKLKPDSAKLIQALITTNKTSSIIFQTVDCKTLPNPSIDLNILKNISQSSSNLQSINQNSDLKPTNKKPRLDKGNSISYIRLILNDLDKQAQQLLSVPRSTFDDSDFVLMRKVKSKIEKCLND